MIGQHLHPDLLLGRYCNFLPKRSISASSPSLRNVVNINLDQTLNAIVNGGLESCFRTLQRGIEKESLRVNPDGTLSQKPHPHTLGSALTHPSITTDYSEALLEFVTPIHTSIDGLLRELTDIHRYTYQNIVDEMLWVNSMPCIVLGEQAIPIAQYGSSNIAQMKETYRRGLGHRYGRLMQTIAGIHYNFSLPDEFWTRYLKTDEPTHLVRERSTRYFALTRNFLRNAWLICYLFGASPAVCQTFLQGRPHQLAKLKEHSFYAPHATSLRLSNLGYSNDAQSTLAINYNSLGQYVTTLRKAIQTPWAPYQAIPVTVDGVYQQLNPNLLQIENEFYSVIRPKQVARSGESPSGALRDRGVQYVEIRSLDLDPFTPIGISPETIRFLDLFLLYCLFRSDQPIHEAELQQATENRLRVVMEGRKPDLHLQFEDGEVPFQKAAITVLDQMMNLSALLDGVCGGTAYQHTLSVQRARVEDPTLTPSARTVDTIEKEYDSFFSFAMHQAKAHQRYFKDWQITADTMQHYQQQATWSLEQQAAIEASDTLSFEEFLTDYFRRQNDT